MVDTVEDRQIPHEHALGFEVTRQSREIDELKEERRVLLDMLVRSALCDDSCPYVKTCGGTNAECLKNKGELVQSIRRQNLPRKQAKGPS